MDLMHRRKDGWDPFDIVSDLQSEMNRAFSRSLVGRENWLRGFQPIMDVREENDHYLISADLPGLRKEDFKISIEGSRLTLQGERKEKKETKEKGCFYSERSYGSFSRTIEFPTEVQGDKVKATYNNGVLEVTLPKSESAKPKQIDVEVK